MKRFLILAGTLIVLAMLVACAAPATSASLSTAVPALPTEAPTRPAATAVPVKATTASTQVPAQVAALTVTSTLDGLTTLPHRIAWVAQPLGSKAQAVNRVAYFIDGQPAWVEKVAPYYYGSDGNYLVTSFLTPGVHNFTVRAFTADGLSAGSTVTATVATAPIPPDGLANTSWSREVTSSDMKKATSSQPPPPGHWGLSINSEGWMLHDPVGTGLFFDEAYQSGGQVDLRASIEKPPYPSDTGGGFCDEPDQPFLWTYTFGNGGKTLALHPVGQDPCGDRVAILEGTWTRQEK